MHAEDSGFKSHRPISQQPVRKHLELLHCQKEGGARNCLESLWIDRALHSQVPLQYRMPTSYIVWRILVGSACKISAVPFYNQFRTINKTFYLQSVVIRVVRWKIVAGSNIVFTHLEGEVF